MTYDVHLNNGLTNRKFNNTLTDIIMLILLALFPIFKVSLINFYF